MNQIKFFSLAVLGVFILGACSTSNSVVSGGILQKRKHTKGVYWDRNERVKSDKDKTEEEFDIFRINEESHKNYVTTTTIYNEDRNVSASVSEEVSLVENKSDNIVLVSENSTSSTTPAVVTEKEESSQEAQTNTKKSNTIFKAKKQSAPAGDVNTILLVILALLIPPLAVFLYEGATGRFWIDLILALVGWGVGFYFLGGLGFVCGLAAVIYALLIVLGVI